MSALARWARLVVVSATVAGVCLPSAGRADDAPQAATDAHHDETAPVLSTDGLTGVLNLDPLLPASWRSEGPAEKKRGWSALLLPNIRLNPDEGFGLGLVMHAAYADLEAKPYKLYLGLRSMATLKLVQRHELAFDAVRIFGTPLRVDGRVGFYAVVFEPFCGVGPEVTCDPAAASKMAERRGLEGEDRAAFENTYYAMRMLRPYAWANFRYDLPLGLKLFGGGRIEYVYPGAFGDVLAGELLVEGPYPDSMFAQYAPDGQEGLSHVWQGGLVYDTRDHEPDPTRGVLVEGSLRGAHAFIGSAWDFAGANVGVRAFAPLDPYERLILASRLVLDAATGDVPVQELARVGGIIDYRAFGGVAAGRGIRQQRYIGQGKAISQNELRWRAARVVGLGTRVDVVLLGFVDAATVVTETLAPFKEPWTLGLSGGGGMRLVVNRNIVLRFDLGFSREEGFVPAFYIDSGQTF